MTTTTQSAPPVSIDECVRLVTAFQSFEDLTDTLPSYAPTIYRRGLSNHEQVCAHRVVVAFNAWAKRAGRTAVARLI
jgi:hypothetical protein